MNNNKDSANAKRRKVMIAGLTGASALFVGSGGMAWAQQKPLKEQLVGAWTLVSIEVTSKGGAKAPGFGGPNAKGILILDAGGRYAQVTGSPDRPKLKTTVRKDIPAAELGEAARTFGARFGTWSVIEADKMLIQTSELQMIPNEATSETKSSVRLAGNELKLVAVSAAGGTTEFVYRRAK